MGLRDTFEKYSGGNGADWFSLKNDGDFAIVRFLYRGEQDLDFTVIHDVEIDGSKRKVECLEYQGQECPLCQAGSSNRARMFLQLKDFTDGKVKVWERGKTFLPEILTFIDSCEPIYTIRAKVVRHGKAGDPKTQYKISPLLNDDPKFKLEDTEQNMETLNDTKEDIFGENSKVIRADYEALSRMVNGTFSFQNNQQGQNPINNNNQNNNFNNNNNQNNNFNGNTGNAGNAGNAGNNNTGNSNTGGTNVF